tara:strand:+ start:968 stop:1363 length:396 start_codon:yes stop_codon:yes gene_type:complete
MRAAAVWISRRLSFSRGPFARWPAGRAPHRSSACGLAPPEIDEKGEPDQGGHCAGECPVGDHDAVGLKALEPHDVQAAFPGFRIAVGGVAALLAGTIGVLDGAKVCFPAIEEIGPKRENPDKRNQYPQERN